MDPDFIKNEIKTAVMAVFTDQGNVKDKQGQVEDTMRDIKNELANMRLSNDPKPVTLNDLYRELQTIRSGSFGFPVNGYAGWNHPSFPPPAANYSQNRAPGGQFNPRVQNPGNIQGATGAKSLQFYAQPTRTADGRIICHYCKKPGHYMRECRGRARDMQQQNQLPQQAQNSGNGPRPRPNQNGLMQARPQ